MKQTTPLTTQEKQLVQDYTDGKYHPIQDGAAKIQRYQNIARRHTKKDRTISLRIASSDIEKLKARSIESGIPYQTLITSLIRQYNQRKITLQL
ncbi:MAG: hypothetical protein H6774_02595 [Pseudomonadales bacterium]|nr:hypothetical protein [Candidatus Woesebacteria bacterium]MCB9801953.1 hypothetical protein [Pseudomonadales bacterium]